MDLCPDVWLKITKTNVKFFSVSSNLKHRFELKMIYLEKLVIFSFRVQ
jgi:hypothetical protein